MARQNWNLLVPHLLRASVDADATIERLKKFAALLLEWNGNISNLISRADAPRLVERHILESVEPAHWLASSGATKWLDLGSGGGFPALPLAIIGVGESWTLVESRRNKALFLRRVVQDLGLPGVTVVQDRLEDLPSPLAGSEFDGFTSRATMTLAPTLELGARFTRPGGTAFLWKGSRLEGEMKDSSAWKTHWDHDGLLGIGG
jgi:16S rRNA (guanine527-N7)-methyltransferase